MVLRVAVVLVDGVRLVADLLRAPAPPPPGAGYPTNYGATY